MSVHSYFFRATRDDIVRGESLALLSLLALLFFPAAIISLARGHADEFIRLNDVTRQMSAVHATGIESDCERRALRLFLWPVTQQNGFRAAIDLVPGGAFASGGIRAHRANFSEVAGHLLV